MDVGALATAFASTRTAQLQMAVAAKMMAINTGAEAAVAQVLDAAQENMRGGMKAMVAAGIGEHLDLSV